MSELLKLAERCEAAAGSDRDLDVDIHEAIGNVVDRGCPAEWHSGEETPRYSESIDAAMMLVREDAQRLRFWRVGNDGEGGDPSAFKAEILVVTNLTSVTSKAIAATPALALCAASLRARAAQEQS